jgi:putative DNA primase/helicase
VINRLRLGPDIGAQLGLARLKLLLDLIEEFSFVNDLDRAVALAALMTPVLRGACDVAPMILILAHTASSGKSFLADITNTIVRGQKCPVITAAESVEEMEKRLGALILEGVQIISLDNCSHNLGGDLLCQITERPLIRIRILGKSQTPECEWCGTLFANGNNILLLDDMTRRAIICNLDPKMERPEQREFKNNPIEMVMADRGAYIAAILSIARAYLMSGESVKCPPIASYGQWSRMVREPLIWLGEADVVKSMEQARDIDPDRTSARELVEHWGLILGYGQSYTSNDIVRIATGGEKIKDNKETETWIFHHPEFRELLISRCGTGSRVESRLLGRWLMKIRGQIHNDQRIDLVESRTHGNKFKLTALKKPAPEVSEVSEV